MPMPVDDLVRAQRDAEKGLQQRDGKRRQHAAARDRSTGLPVSQKPIAPTNAPISIMPSRLMLSTPARSLTSSPVAASSIGVARRIDEADEDREKLDVHRRASLAFEPHRAAPRARSR